MHENTISLTDRTFTALNWRFLSELSIGGLQFIVGVVLARLLPVEAFGLIGLAMIVIGFANVISEIGMAPALVQRTNLTETHVRVGFTVSSLAGALLVAGMYLVAPFAASIFQTSELIPVLRLLSLVLLLKSLSSTAGALLQRRLAFRQLFWVETVSYAFGYAMVGVVLALMGRGVWALVWASFVQSLIRAMLLFLVSPHQIRPSFAVNETRELLHFGVGTSLARIVNYAARNGDYLVVGQRLGVEALGLYTRAYQLMTLPTSHFSSVIGAVLFPAYAEIQTESTRLKRAYFRSISVTTLVVFPLLVGLAIAAPELIRGIYGAKWTGATVAFQILCVGGIGRAMYNLADALVRAKGAVYQQFVRHFLYALAIFGAAIIGTRWGIEGVAVGVVCALGMMYFLMGHLANKLVTASWSEFLRAQMPGMILATIVASVALPATLMLRSRSLPDLVILSGTILVCAVAMMAAVFILPEHWLGEARPLLIDQFARARDVGERLLRSLIHQPG